MDKSALVREQLDGGEKLIAQLVADRFDVTAAGWVQTTEDGRPYLFIASKTADAHGLRSAYGTLAAAVLSLERQWSHWMERVDPSEVKILRTSEPLARGMLEETRRNRNDYPAWISGLDLGGISIDGGCLYPSRLFAMQPEPQTS